MVDISNIAAYNKRNDHPKLSYIDLLFNTLPEDIEIIAIADCALFHQIDDKVRYKKKYLITKRIIEAPAQFQADGFILTYAFENKIKILSNDRFHNYTFVPKEWLCTHRFGFMIINDQLIFEKPLSLLFDESLSTPDTNSITKIYIDI